MKNIYVKAKRTYPQFEHFFKEGDILTLTPILYGEDTLIANEVWGWLDKDNKVGILIPRQKNEDIGKLNKNAIKVFDSVTAPCGSYKGYKITNEDGITVTDSTIINMIGYATLDKLFIKLN